MTAELLTYAFALSLFVWVTVLGREIGQRAWRRELRETFIRDRNRNRFAILRDELLALARVNKIDVRSEFFQEAYRTLSELAWHPESHLPTTVSLLSPPKATEIRRKAEHWSPEEIRLLLRVARCLDLMCRDYNRSYRAAAWLLDRLEFADARKIYKAPLWVLMQLRSQKVEEARALRRAGRDLERRIGVETAVA